MTFQDLQQEFAIASEEMIANQAAYLRVDPTKIDIKTQMEAAGVFTKYQIATIEMNNIVKKIILQDAIRKELTGNE